MHRSNRARESYLMIDHRASPGVSAEDAAASGMPAVGAGQLFEAGTITCAHCQRIVIRNPQRTRPRGYCAKCDYYICDSPACHADCRPFKAVLEQAYEETIRHEGQSRGLILPPGLKE